MSLDIDLTRLRKGLEEERGVDLQGEADVYLVDGGLTEGRSEGHEELAGGSELRWEGVDVDTIFMAEEGVCG